MQPGNIGPPLAGDNGDVPLIVWSDDYSIGVPEIDAQHRRLVEMLNELHESMLRGDGHEVVHEILSGLVQYTRAHFAAEERLMQSVNYPDYTAHKGEHERLTLKVVEYQAKQGPGEVTRSLDVLWLLWDWVQEHISGRDKAIGAYVASSHCAESVPAKG
jgi:hemerythrin